MELKKVLYAFLGLSGVGLLLIAFNLSHSRLFTDEITRVILFITGTGLLFFAAVTYLVREDWEIWQ